MSTVINTNSMATRTANIFNRNNAMMNGALTRLATQQRINSAKDNASTYAISERMRERIRANDQANRNSQNDAALLKTAQGGLDNTLSILTTLKERAIDAANDSNINTNRQAIVTEVQSLVQQIDDNANKVKFNGRTLLNGAVDSSSGASSSNGATAISPTGDKAVYSITNLKIAGSSAGTTAAATSATKLVELVDNNGKALFSEGDKITLSWKANGTEMSKVTTVQASTTLANLGGNGLTGAWKAASDPTGAKDGNLDDLKATSAGVYFVGADTHTRITDVSLSVAYTNSDGTTGRRTNAESALKINAVQQAFGPATGSNAVFAKTVTDFGTAVTAITVSGGGATLKDLGVLSNYSDSKTLNIDEQKITITGTMTVDDLNQALKGANINVRAQFAAKGETLKYDGVEVTRGAADYATPVKSTTDGEFYFIGAAGVDISSIKVDSTAYKNPLKVSADASGNAGGSMLPQGNALTFFVGGEANFGVNFAIGKATAGNLLGSGASAFASRFATSEGAQSAIGLIDNAITKTLNEQARLGSMESRMGYISDNLTTMNENLESADSVLRDTDPAKEMANYMKYMVMSQAAQYMMVQANQNAFQVANLLQP